jgi:hypothetical protein
LFLFSFEIHNAREPPAIKWKVGQCMLRVVGVNSLFVTGVKALSEALQVAWLPKFLYDTRFLIYAFRYIAHWFQNK